jgi:hypothetical protein
MLRIINDNPEFALDCGTDIMQKATRQLTGTVKGDYGR